MATPSPTTFESTSRRGFGARLAEEALAASQHNRVHHQPQLIDEVMLDQRLHEPGAAVDDDVAILLLLQLPDLLRADYRPLYLDDPTSDGLMRLRVAAFEHLPLTPANQDLLSLVAQHPNARVDTNPQNAPSK